MTGEERKGFARHFEEMLAVNDGIAGIVDAYLTDHLEFSPEDFEKEIPYTGDVEMFEPTKGVLFIRFCGEEDLSKADLCDLLAKAKEGKTKVGITVNFAIHSIGAKPGEEPIYSLGYVVGDDAANRRGNEDFIIEAYREVRNGAGNP